MVGLQIHVINCPVPPCMFRLVCGHCPISTIVVYICIVSGWSSVRVSIRKLINMAGIPSFHQTLYLCAVTVWCPLYPLLTVALTK
jgi:hypothetical protein